MSVLDTGDIDIERRLARLASSAVPAPRPAFTDELELRLRALAAGEVVAMPDGPRHERRSGRTRSPVPRRWMATALAAAAVITAVVAMQRPGPSPERSTRVGSDSGASGPSVGAPGINESPATTAPPASGSATTAPAHAGATATTVRPAIGGSADRGAGATPTTSSAPGSPSAAPTTSTPAQATPTTAATVVPTTAAPRAGDGTTASTAPAPTPTTAPTTAPGPTTTAPPAPTTTTTTGSQQTALTLSCTTATPSGRPTATCTWSRSTSTSFASYRLRRATMDGPWQVAFTTTDRGVTTGSDSAVGAGITYRFQVDALDASGVTLATSPVVTVPCC